MGARSNNSYMDSSPQVVPSVFLFGRMNRLQSYIRPFVESVFLAIMESANRKPIGKKASGARKVIGFFRFGTDAVAMSQIVSVNLVSGERGYAAMAIS